MSPAGPGTKNDCPCEGISNLLDQPTGQNHEQKNMVMGPVEPRTKNDYAGEGQWQFTSNPKNLSWVRSEPV
jgi:hypothetical protein